MWRPGLDGRSRDGSGAAARLSREVRAGSATSALRRRDADLAVYARLNDASESYPRRLPRCSVGHQVRPMTLDDEPVGEEQDLVDQPARLFR